MEPYTLLMVPSGTKTRLLLTHGAKELLRAELPGLEYLRHGRSVATLLEGVAQWMDSPLRVVLCADASGTTYWTGLTDERGCGARGLYYEVQLCGPREKRRAGRVRGLGERGQMWLLGPRGQAGGRP